MAVGRITGSIERLSALREAAKEAGLSLAARELGRAEVRVGKTAELTREELEALALALPGDEEIARKTEEARASDAREAERREEMRRIRARVRGARP